MTELFRRACVVDVGTTRVKDLRMAFKIEKTLKVDPNTLELQIYNLSENTRKKLQGQGVPVQLLAGYQEDTLEKMEVLFKGDSTYITHFKNGADWITKVKSGDGDKAVRTARVSLSFASGTQIKDAMLAIANKTGLALGNMVEELVKGNVRAPLTSFIKGAVASGGAVDELHKLARTMGYDFSIQDGAIQLVEPGKTTASEIVNLTPKTGLIGSPEVGEKGIIKVRSLIQQKLLPGRKLRMESQSLTGIYRIEKVTYTGDTHDTPWFAELEMRPVT